MKAGDLVERGQCWEHGEVNIVVTYVGEKVVDGKHYTNAVQGCEECWKEREA